MFDMRKKFVFCDNCEQKFQEDFQFCPHCGQKRDEDLTLKVLFYNTITNYFCVDARFFKSFIPLLIKPGFLAKGFVSGKRLLYLHPAQFYLFVSVVFFFLFSFISREQEQQLDALLSSDFNVQNNTQTTRLNNKLDSLGVELIDEKSIGLSQDASNSKPYVASDTIQEDDALNIDSFDFKRKTIDSLIAIKASNDTIYKEMGLSADASKLKRKFYAQILKFYKKRGGGILAAFYDTIPIAMFILLPIFAFILKIFFYKTGRYAHHLVFSFYYFSFLFTMFSLLLLINYIVNIPNWIDWLSIWVLFIYLFLAVKYFYEKGWVTSFFRSAFVTFIYLTIVIPIAVVIIAISAFMFY